MKRIWKLCYDCGLEWFDKVESDEDEAYRWCCPNCGGAFEMIEEERTYYTPKEIQNYIKREMINVIIGNPPYGL